MDMRAKMQVASVTKHEYGETLILNAVAKNGSYPDDGSDEDNTYAKYTPSATLEMQINNPALAGTFEPNDTFYVDFTKVEKTA